MQKTRGDWTRNWEHYGRMSAGGSRVEELSNEELLEYLRWMACNRPERYGRLMTAFVQAH